MALLALALFAAFVPGHGDGRSGGVLSTPHDVALKIKPDPDGTSQLSFLVYGDGGAEYTISNDNNGALRIESGEKLCLEVKTASSSEAKDATSLLQLSSEPAIQITNLLRATDRSRQLLNSRRRTTGRKLLAPVKPVDVALADLITTSGRFNVSGGYIASTSSGNVKIAGVRQWKMILHEDFHRGTVGDWENQGDQFPLPDDNGISTCVKVTSPNADYFLGSYGNMEAVKTYLLPAHTRVRVKARLHFFDDWNGEIVYLKIGGNIVWSKAHKWCNKIITTMCAAGEGEHEAGNPTISICGNPHFPDTLSVPLDAIVSHTGVELEVAVGSNVKSAQATWGMDDLEIYIM